MPSQSKSIRDAWRQAAVEPHTDAPQTTDEWLHALTLGADAAVLVVLKHLLDYGGLARYNQVELDGSVRRKPLRAADRRALRAGMNVASEQSAFTCRAPHCWAEYGTPCMDCPVTMRRAEFVYEGARLQAIAVDAPIVPEPWGDREQPFRDQFYRVIEMMCGPDRKSSPEELHDDWVRAYEAMGWVYGPERDREAKTHPDMVPFADLEQREQDKDAVFIALCEIARQWIGSRK